MSRDRAPEDRRAPEGKVWQCAACGKFAEDRYGMTGKRSVGWDESCVLNAVPSDAVPPWSTRYLKAREAT